MATKPDLSGLRPLLRRFNSVYGNVIHKIQTVSEPQFFNSAADVARYYRLCRFEFFGDFAVCKTLGRQVGAQTFLQRKRLASWEVIKRIHSCVCLIYGIPIKTTWGQRSIFVLKSEQ